MSEGLSSPSGPVEDLLRSRRRRRIAGIGLAVVVLLGLGIGVWLQLSREEGVRDRIARGFEPVVDAPPAAPPVAAPPRAETVEPAVLDASEDVEVEVEVEEPAQQRAALPLPELDASDALVLELGGSATGRSDLRGVFLADRLVRRLVALTVNVAEGEDLAKTLEFLRPEERLRTRPGEDDTLLIDPASYARYDTLVELFDAVDPTAAEQLFARVEPLFDRAYRELGYTEGSYRDALERAIERLLATPEPEGPLALAPEDTFYEFADPDLQTLDPAQRQLLRLGPEHGRVVRAKLRDLQRALIAKS